MTAIDIILCLFAIILGILIGLRISRMCNLNVKYVGPNSKDIKKKIYYCEKTDCHYKLLPEICLST